MYYINTSGKVYEIDFEVNLEQEINQIEENEINVKNIVNVIPVEGGLLSGSYFPIFVDIDGNTFKSDGQQLN